MLFVFSFRPLTLDNVWISPNIIEVLPAGEGRAHLGAQNAGERGVGARRAPLSCVRSARFARSGAFREGVAVGGLETTTSTKKYILL